MSGLNPEPTIFFSFAIFRQNNIADNDDFSFGMLTLYGGQKLFWLLYDHSSAWWEGQT